MTRPPALVLELLGVRPGSLVTLKDLPLENGSWLAENSGGARVVLRRYHAGATAADLAYEHSVLNYLAGRGWVVPAPLTELCQHDGLFYCLTRYVPGSAVARRRVPKRSSAAAAVTWPGCSWRCAASASESGSAPAGARSTPGTPCTPRSTGRRASAR
jgi:Ser/Thr protein kinase RdoA (MazF antagonist)